MGGAAEEWRPRSAVEIRRGTQSPPLFLVHSGTGNVTDYAGLATHFAEGQRIIGLVSRGLSDEDEPLTTVEEMAEAYLEEVRRIQPEGPYLFAAWSMGGYVALEMARRLGPGAADVLLVGPPLHWPMSRRRIRRANRGANRLVRELTRALADGTPLRPSAERDLLASWTLDEEGTAAVRAGDPTQQRAGRVNILNTVASARYQSVVTRQRTRHDRRVVALLPTDDAADARLATLEQWRAAAPETLEVVDAPGTHFTLIRGEEGARFAGEWLSAELARHAEG